MYSSLDGAGRVTWSQDAAGPRLSILSYLQLSAVPPLMYEDFLNAKTLASCRSLKIEWCGKGSVCLFYLKYLYLVIWNAVITLEVQLTGNVLQYFTCTAQWTHSVSGVNTNELILSRDVNSVCSDTQIKHINIHTGLNVKFKNVKPGSQKVKVKVNQSRYRPGVAQRLPGS